MFRELGFILIGLLLTAIMTVHYVGHQTDRKIKEHEEKIECQEEHKDKCSN